MAISITWGTRVIYVPKADCTLIQASPTEIRELNINTFRLWLKDLEDDEEGMPHPDTHRHNTEVTLGGITYARTVEIINGYTVTFEDGQWAVNLVGANHNVGDVVNVNQVSVRVANSAGLISSPDIEYSSFNGGVTVDVTTSNTGTIYPTGTPRLPVNNLSDAHLIAEYRGFDTFYIVGDITISSGQTFDEHRFEGQSPNKTHITIDADADVTGCEFYNAEITGTLDGGAVLRQCLVHNLTYVSGYIEQCILGSDDIVLGGSMEAHFLDCWSGVVGTGVPTLDMGGTGQGAGLRNFNGGIEVRNKSGTEKIIIDLNSGHVTIDATVTDGEVVIRGVGGYTDNSTGSAVVTVTDLSNPENDAAAVWADQVATDLVAAVEAIEDVEFGDWRIESNQMIFLSPESVEIARFNLFDQSGTPAMTSVYKREKV